MRSNGRTGWMAAIVLAATWLAACETPKPPERLAPMAAVRMPDPAAAAKAAAPSSIRNLVQGRWAGRSEGGDVTADWQLTIAGEAIEARTSDGQSYKGTIKINDQVVPAQMDVLLTQCTDANFNGQTVRGIVKLEGAKATFCVSRPDDATRPARFDASEGILIVAVRK